MSSTKTQSLEDYLVTNRILFLSFDKISRSRMIDIKQVTLFDVAKKECIDGDPKQLLYEFEPLNNNRQKTRITNYPDQPMRSPLTVESLRNFVIDEFAQYSDRTQTQWNSLIRSIKLLYRCYYCRTYHVRNMKSFVEKGNNNEDCPLCLYSYDVIQHRMNKIGFDVEGDEKAWNTRNAGKNGSHVSFTLFYNNCECTHKCTMEIKQFRYLNTTLKSTARQITTDGTYSCPNKSGAGFTTREIGDFGEEYIKNIVRKFCRNHDLPGLILYAHECGPGDLIFGIANEKYQTKYDIMYIRIQIKTKSGNSRWHINNIRSYPDDVLGILLNIDKKSVDANVDLVIMETWRTLTSDITKVPGEGYNLLETKMLKYAIAETSEVPRAIMMFYYEALSNNTTMTYEEAIRPWPNHKTVSFEFQCQQSTENTNRKWCVYECYEGPYSKADNTITMKVRMNADYTEALNKKLFYVIVSNDTEGFAIIRMNDQSKSWAGVQKLKQMCNFEHPIYEGPFAENICDQVHLFHWYERSMDENYLIPFANVRRYVNTDMNEKQIKYGSVIKKLFDEDGNWQRHFKDYSYRYETEIPIRLLSKLTGLKAKDILKISNIDLPERQIGFLDTEEILLKITDLM